MSSVIDALTAAQREQIQSSWGEGLSAYVKEYLRKSAIAHWSKDVRSYEEEDSEDLFETLLVKIHEKSESDSNQITAPNPHYRGHYELRWNGLDNKTHITIAIATSWEVGWKNGLDSYICLRLREVGIPDHLVKIIWDRCDLIFEPICSEEAASV